MPIKSSPARQQLLFAAALSLLIAVAAASFYTINRLIALGDQAEHSQAVIAALNRYMSEMQGIESEARSPAGDGGLLAPHRAGDRDARNMLGPLRDLAGADSALARRVDALEWLTRRQIALAREARRPDRTAGTPPALPDPGRAGMDRIREEIGAALDAEQAARRARDRAVEREAATTNIVLGIGVSLGFAVIAWLYLLRGREVSRRRAAEEELRQANTGLEARIVGRTAELTRSQGLLKAVIENIPDAIFLKDGDDEFRYSLVNAAAERLTGMDRAAMIGHADHELFPREEARASLREDREVARTGQSRFARERPIQAAGGTRMIESCKVPIADENGRNRFVLGIVRDLTAHRALEDQLRQSQRMDAVGRLTGGIAHDFNNILAIVLGNVDLLREQLAAGSEAAEMADEAMDAATHGADLVRRLLAFARMQHLDARSIDLNDRLPAIAALLKRTLGERIRLRVEAAPDLWLALVDPTQVDDALVNLAINARDAMPGGGSLTIETANERLDEDYAAQHEELRPGDYVMLAVSDTGTGMAPEIMASAFEPFFTTKAEGQGTGLGLSQVYGWIKQSNGHVKIYSELGHGTTVKLYLPRAFASKAAAAATTDEPGPAPSGDETILVVEDNEKVRATVLRQLADLGYTALEAADGEAALALVRAGAAFDLLLTDVVMPGGMTGYQLADAVRALRPDLKALYTSGYTELAASNGHEGGRGPLLSKPYRKRDLGKALRAALEKRADSRPSGARDG